MCLVNVNKIWFWFWFSGVATGVARGGRVPPLTAKICQKSGKRWKKIRKNREEQAKIWEFLSLCPSWQIRLATLLFWFVVMFWVLQFGTLPRDSAPLTSIETSANSLSICVMGWSVINLPWESDIRCGIWTLSILIFGIFLVQVSSATWTQDLGESLWKIRLCWFGYWQYWGLWNLLIISMVRSILTYALKWVCSFLLSRGYSLFRKFGNFNLISLSK